jgi:hypothetical protein
MNNRSATADQRVRDRRLMGLTWRDPNSPVLVEGPEIMIQPVGVRHLPMEVARVKHHDGDVRCQVSGDRRRVSQSRPDQDARCRARGQWPSG